MKYKTLCAVLMVCVVSLIIGTKLGKYMTLETVRYKRDLGRDGVTSCYLETSDYIYSYDCNYGYYRGMGKLGD